ncbi:MAG: hypothetical protein LBL92_06380, partial [Propionibacteriaceae bacterium]|nr:hypothetical protein [Propionibacteriaceae bacterium]
MIGLQLALPAEAASLLADIEQPRRESRWGQSLTWGRLAGQDVVLTLSGVGKVAAATTTAMLAQLDVSLILVAGTSGGLAVGVEPGDVLIATE